MPDPTANPNPKPTPPDVSVRDGAANVVGGDVGTLNNSIHFAAPGSVPLGGGVPRLPRHYVEREAKMNELADQFGEGDQAAVTDPAVASGDGGHGKTVLARAYAHQFKDRYPGGCYALECETGSLLTGLASLVVALDVGAEVSEEAKAQYARATLSQDRGCLLILDNVRDAEQWNDPAFQALLPTPPCHILVTTRAEHLPGTREVNVGKLTEDEAFAVLANFRPSATDDAHREAIRTILAEVECLAAAVAAVGAVMMLDGDDDWAGYAEDLKNAPLSALPDGIDAVRAETGYAGKTAQVLDDLRERLPDAEVRVLDYAALLPADKIVPLWLEVLLAADAERDGDAKLDLGCKLTGRPRTPADVIAHLKALDLITTAAGDAALQSVHRLHRRRASELLEREPNRGSILLDAIVAMAEERGKASRAAPTEPGFRPELTPLAAMACALDAAGRFEAAVRLSNWIVEPLHRLGRFAEGRGLLKLMETRCETNPDTVSPGEQAILYSNLAQIFKAQGDLPEARRLTERAIEIDEKHLDPDHPNLAIRYSNLATIAYAQGDRPEARRLVERAIEIASKHFKPDHPHLVLYQKNLAVIQRAERA